MLLYTTVGTNDLQRAGRFYDAILPLIGYSRQKEGADEIGYAADEDVRARFWVVDPSTVNLQPSATA
jgi:catechol 2,3-dioxygenase-like lactoylglutathione lyase family enzyme